MIRIRKATASVNDWANLSKSLASLFQLREVCAQFDEDMRPAAEDVPSIFNKVKDEICPWIHNLEVKSTIGDFRKRSVMTRVCSRTSHLWPRFGA